ncbi:CG14342 [Drosophila busckii]|uniref:CG14342 n=1 Tax=Drosophila busckii TaxID=30019 RepID=A0A0M5J3A2_DROBS|nr:CG14342 [Drosophila busckii]
MNALQKQWYRVLLARRVGFGQRPLKDEKELTYSDLCHKRYMNAFRRYNERFHSEMLQHEQMQRCALDSMRVHRTFSITTLWLPLHSKREINATLETLERVLTIKERRRLEEILKQFEMRRTRR